MLSQTEVGQTGVKTSSKVGRNPRGHAEVTNYMVIYRNISLDDFNFSNK